MSHHYNSEAINQTEHAHKTFKCHRSTSQLTPMPRIEEIEKISLRPCHKQKKKER